VGSVLSDLNRLLTYDSIPAELGVSMFVYRTLVEIDYVARLDALDAALLVAWCGREDVDERAYCYTKPQLCVDFRFIRKDSRYWTNYVRNERRSLEATGLLVPHQCTQQNNMTMAAKGRAYATAIVGATRIEPPVGCNSELPSVCTYKFEDLMDPQCRWWVVYNTEKAAKTAAVIMMDAYDNYRLWIVSERMCGFLKKLNMKPILGSDANVTEFASMLELIEATNFRRLPSSWRSNAKRRGNQPGADFMYYDPHKGECITEGEYRVLRS